MKVEPNDQRNSGSPAHPGPSPKRHEYVTLPGGGRRSFMAIAIALGAGAVSVLTPLVTGLLVVAAPLRRSKTLPDAGGEEDGMLRLSLAASSLATDGTPQQVCVNADRMDAWNHLPAQTVGTVWARRNEAGEVLVFSSTCPHLGCCVEYRGAQRDFSCPCHNSSFALDGSRLNAIPPRDLDRLGAKVVGDAIWIRYEQFRGGIAEKTPL